MAMKEIPDLRYELSEDGDMLNMEQGYLEPVLFSLHRIHLEHFAKVMKIGLSEDVEPAPQLVDYLERINEQASDLYHLLAGVPSFPPQQQESEDVSLAKQLMEQANMALTLWGNN